MQGWRCFIMALALFCSWGALGLAQEPGPGTTTIQGVLTIIKGDVYTMQDRSGRFVQFRVDKNTQRERLVVPGERVEVQMSANSLALSIKPVR